MKYKGYSIEPVYLPGSDFTVFKNGIIKTRKPKKEDIEFYTIEDLKTGWCAANCANVEEAKAHIDDLNKSSPLTYN